MFCGIVDHVGILDSITKKPKGTLCRIHSQFSDFSLGESIAIDGTCLTVTASKANIFDCELSPETLNVTIAAQYQIGQSLNIERAMRINDRIGGHWVTGHVNETILLKNKVEHGEFIELHFSIFSEENLLYLIPKGSVTINGVSLTVNTVNDVSFSVMLISHTLKRTNLSKLNVGDFVNVEWDYIARLIQKQVEKYHAVNTH